MIYLLNAYRVVHFSSINVLVIFNHVLLDILLNQATFFLSLLMIGVLCILFMLVPILFLRRKLRWNKVREEGK